jgi:hypothetical protein
MSDLLDPGIRVRTDPTNPGQFFACCGLLELADRLWRGVEGWFEDGTFLVRTPDASASVEPRLATLVSAVADTHLLQVDTGDDYSSPIELPAPFNLRVDWWKNRTGGDQLKVWAGSMRSARIACAMQHVLQRPELQNDALLDYGTIVYDPLDTDKKVEPFYFDARRGSNAQSIDIGFAPDSLHMTNAAYPAVEFLCLVGLQRFRPMPTDTRRVFDYHTWTMPLAIHVAPLAACGLLTQVGGNAFRFEVAFRTDQRKHKAFTPATLIKRRNE